MKTIKLYHYDNFTGEFQNITEPYEGSEIPPFSTEKEPPNEKVGYARVFKDNEWVYVEDHRGEECFSTLDATQIIINKLGRLPKHATLLKPNNWDDVWDGNRWSSKPPLSKKELMIIAEQQKYALLTKATAMIAPLQDAVDLKIATDDEIILLKEWKKYRVLLNRVDTSTAPDVAFPEKPE